MTFAQPSYWRNNCYTRPYPSERGLAPHGPYTSPSCKAPLPQKLSTLILEEQKLSKRAATCKTHSPEECSISHFVSHLVSQFASQLDSHFVSHFISHCISHFVSHLVSHFVSRFDSRFVSRFFNTLFHRLFHTLFHTWFHTLIHSL